VLGTAVALEQVHALAMDCNTQVLQGKPAPVITSLRAASGVFSACGQQRGRREATEAFLLNSSRKT